jgi:hypothetical protein
MSNAIGRELKTVVDREMLMNLKTCTACGRRFNLGEPVVLAYGAWEGPPKWIHEEEAVFDRQKNAYVERECFEAGRKPER